MKRIIGRYILVLGFAQSFFSNKFPGQAMAEFGNGTRATFGFGIKPGQSLPFMSGGHDILDSSGGIRLSYGSRPSAGSYGPVTPAGGGYNIPVKSKGTYNSGSYNSPVKTVGGHGQHPHAQSPHFGYGSGSVILGIGTNADINIPTVEKSVSIKTEVIRGGAVQTETKTYHMSTFSQPQLKTNGIRIARLELNSIHPTYCFYHIIRRVKLSPLEYLAIVEKQTTPTITDVRYILIGEFDDYITWLEKEPLKHEQQSPVFVDKVDSCFGTHLEELSSVSFKCSKLNNIKRCNLQCSAKHSFHGQRNQISIFCSENARKWVSEELQFDEIPKCEPICTRKCKNNGICVSPDHCSCPSNYGGLDCSEFRGTVCTELSGGLNAERACSTSKKIGQVCNISCRKGYSFESNVGAKTIKCLDGKWVEKDNVYVTIPDCEPVCKNSCKNGGKCLAPEICQCPEEYYGPQCQYHQDICLALLEPLNIDYHCQVDSTGMSCNFSCQQYEFHQRPAVNLYTCNWSRGKLEPSPLPSCKLPVGFVFQHSKTILNHETHHVLKTEQTEYTLAYNFETIAQNILAKRRNKSNTQITITTSKKQIVPGSYTLYVDSQTRIKSPPGPSVCETWDSYSVKTFDGLIYNTPLHCLYDLVDGAVESGFKISLQGCAKDPCVHHLTIYVNKVKYTFTNEDGQQTLSTDKKKLSIWHQLKDMQILAGAGQNLIVKLDAIGVSITWDWKSHVTIEAAESLWNKTKGLCGTTDQNVENDFMDKHGVVHKTPRAFVDSWKSFHSVDCSMEQETSRKERECTTEMEDEGKDLCAKLLTNPIIGDCLKIFDPNTIVEQCIEEYCNCGNTKNHNSCNCALINVLVNECRAKGVEVKQDWRDTTLCPITCLNGRHHKSCGPKYEATCGSPVIEQKECYEGCFCPDNYVVHKGQCIAKEDCGCFWGQKEYERGNSIKKGCNTCTCKDGEWKCSDKKCGARCSAIGDPHYTTFDGKHYDFMGKCSYYLLKTDNFSVEAENIACPGTISESMGLVTDSQSAPSCTKSLSIRFLTNGKEKAITLSQGSEVHINDKKVQKYPTSVGNGLAVIRKASSIMTTVDFNDGVRIWWDGMTRAYIDVPSSYRDRTRGLCGKFNSIASDDFLTPEGDVEVSVPEFANKWKTSESCEDIKLDPEESECNKTQVQQLCDILLSDVFEECALIVDTENYVADCMFDVCACKEGSLNDCFCPILAAYGAECAEQDIATRWRFEIDQCKIQCEAGQVYDECGDSCLRYCEDIPNKNLCKGHCVEGCRCPTGQYLNEDNECIPAEQCPCIYEGQSYQPGYKGLQAGRKYQELCTCISGAWDCDEATPNQIEKYIRFDQVKQLCVNESFKEYEDCVPQTPKTCKNMDTYVLELDGCKPGCACKLEYVLDLSKDACVLPQNCSCQHAGKSYSDGNEIHEECRDCTCRSGSWECSKKSCASTCSVWGDSHFTTFDGKDFDFQGVCDYVLSKGVLPNGDNFAITIQNVVCGSLGVTCSKTVNLDIGNAGHEDSITLSSDPLKMSSLQKYKKTDTDSMSNFVAYSAGVFTVLEVPTLGLQIKWDRGTRVYVKLDEKWNGKTSGLCGNNNGDLTDDMRSPTKAVEVNAQVFGQSWKLGTSCSKETQIVENACRQNPNREAWATSKCSILKSPVFERCHNKVPFEKYYSRCVYDACACDQGGDCECLCTALAAYSHACASQGVPIRWRTPDLCPMQCDPHCSEYNACVSPCPVETCDNYLQEDETLRMCEKESCFEGCHIKPCENNQIYFNDTFKECVPKSICKPVCMILGEITYYENDIISTDDCHTCRCLKNGMACIGVPCASTVDPYTPAELNIDAKDCIDGWSVWINTDIADVVKSTTNIKRNDIEPIPKYRDLSSADFGGFGVCYKQNMHKIECRVASSGIPHEFTNDDTKCDLINGFVCAGNCQDYEIRIFCQCENEPTSTSPYEFISFTSIASTNVQKCDPTTGALVEHAADCTKYLQCQMNSEGTWDYSERSCGPGTMFNPDIYSCDHEVIVTARWARCGKASTKTHEAFTISTETPVENICFEENEHVPSVVDCVRFNHCVRDIKGRLSYVQKECSEGTMFNQITKTCHWPEEVVKIRPECWNFIPTTAPPERCPPGKKWSECAIPCGHACHYYGKKLELDGRCQPRQDSCVENCVDIDIPTKCSRDQIWRDKSTCVEIADCPCMNSKGGVVKPHESYMESECEICYCADNYYSCTSICDIDPPLPPKPPPILDFNITLIPSIVTPPRACSESLVRLISGDYPLNDAAITASSYLGEKYLPHHSRLFSEPTETSAGVWKPAPADTLPYLQYEFVQPLPVYGVIIRGNPIADEYVTTFKILHSHNGVIQSYLTDSNGQPQFFDGCVGADVPVQTTFEIPVEAKTIRIYPLKWHKSIAIQADILGCEDSWKTMRDVGFWKIKEHNKTVVKATTTVKSTEQEIIVVNKLVKSVACVDPLGVEFGQMRPHQVKASRQMQVGEKLINLLKLTAPKGWQPGLNSPSEFIEFDFLEPRNLTGLITKGGPYGHVSLYSVQYSHNGFVWNNILDQNKNPQKFVANDDADTPKTNYFTMMVVARYLKILPLLWQNTIEMRIEPLGCFVDYPEDLITTVAPPKAKVKQCKLCMDIEKAFTISEDTPCECAGSTLWNGRKCIASHQCPCIVGSKTYEIGEKFQTDECLSCYCTYGGVPKCEVINMDYLCPKNERQVIKENCKKVCEACPEFQRLCPSSGDCIPESNWCNGFVDCDDDEVDCEESATIIKKQHVNITETIVTKVQCPKPSCGPGMVPKFKKRLLAEQGYKVLKKAKIDRSTFNKYKSMLKQVDDENCQEYKCVPDKAWSMNKTLTISCSQPSCPTSFEIEMIHGQVVIPGECGEYKCVPKLPKDAVCHIDGLSFKSFDGVEFKYDICGHILARHMKNRWMVSMFKNCTGRKYVCEKQLVIEDTISKVLLKMNQNFNLLLNGNPYSVQTLSTSSLTKQWFTIAQNGETLLFASVPHDFWVRFTKTGDVRLGVKYNSLNTVDGLCGFYSQNTDDDKKLPDGAIVDSTIIFGNSWQSPHIISENCNPEVCDEQVQKAAFQLCNIIKHETFKPCGKAVDNERFISKCVESTCECLMSNPDDIGQRKNCKCSVLQSFVQECLGVKPDIVLDAWRTVHDCEILCAAPLVHNDCFKRQCEPVCNDAHVECPLLSDSCFSGCYCPSNTIRKGDTCIPYSACKDCVCDGYVRSKYISYDQESFNFDGNCTYLFTRHRNLLGGHNFEVYVNLAACDQSVLDVSHNNSATTYYNSSSSAELIATTCPRAIYIIHDNHTVQLKYDTNSFKQVVDLVTIPSLPYKQRWIEIEKRGKDVITSFAESDLEILTSLEDLRFSIRLPSYKYASKLEGLCGDCNRIREDDLVMNPDNSVGKGKKSDIFKSWQLAPNIKGLDTEDCFTTEEQKCKKPLPRDNVCQQLKNNKLFGACHMIVDYKKYIRYCEDDLCSRGAESTCDTFAAYARECLKRGVCLEQWRTKDFCPYNCVAPRIYNPCGCENTCDQPIVETTQQTLLELECHTDLSEGCFCPEKKVFNNGKCIPSNQCVTCDGQHFADDKWSKDKCTQCECDKFGKTSCITQQCPAEICAEGYEQKKQILEEECCPKVLCLPKQRKECVEAKIPGCGPGQHHVQRNGTNGCVEYVCECIPIEECEKFKLNEPLKSGQYIFNDSTGCCPISKVVCDISLCPVKSVVCENELYDLVEQLSPGDCCPSHKCVPPTNMCIAKVEGKYVLKHYLEEWKDISNPCLKFRCSYTPNGEPKITEEQQQCNLRCKPGEIIEILPNECCGKCVQKLCFDGVKTYEIGQIWQGNCSSHTCLRINDNQLTILSEREVCPDISYCPLEHQKSEGCCIGCKIEPISLKNCVALTPQFTIGLLNFKHEAHGKCVNKEELLDYAVCDGSCPSGTTFDIDTWAQKSFCDCCKPAESKEISVRFTCEDGQIISKKVSVPTQCMCDKCLKEKAINPNWS